MEEMENRNHEILYISAQFWFLETTSLDFSTQPADKQPQSSSGSLISYPCFFWQKYCFFLPFSTCEKNVIPMIVDCQAKETLVLNFGKKIQSLVVFLKD